MCSVVSLLLPSFVLWMMMMVSWLHFFRLGARLGSSTSFRHCIQKFNHRGIRTPNLLIRSQTPYPLGYAAWWGLYHFCFFFCNEWLRWGVKWHTVLAIVSLCNLFLCCECFAEYMLTRSSLFCLVKAGQTDVVGSFSCEPRLGSWTNKLNFTTADEFEPSIFRLESRHPLGFAALRTFPFLFRYSEWISWSVKWPSMLSVVSLLPSFARPLSDDSFVTSLFPFRSTFWIVKLSWHECTC